MIVESIMNTRVITIVSHGSVKEAVDLMREYNIRHLPVVQEGQLVGVVSDRDLRSVCPSVLTGDNAELLSNTRVNEIMQKSVLTVHPLDFIEEAARIVYEHKVGCLPVLSGDKLVGIITEADLLMALVERIGIINPGAHLEVEVPNVPGMLAEVAGIVQSHGVNIISALLFPGIDDTQTIVLRLKALDMRRIIEDIEAAGFKVLWPLPTGYGYER